MALAILVSIANFLVLEGQDLLDTARKNLKASKGILKLIQERFDCGTASALDVAQQASLVAITRGSIAHWCNRSSKIAPPWRCS